MGILDRIRRFNKKRLLNIKNVNNQTKETFVDTYKKEQAQKEEKLYNIITNNQNPENLINNQLSTKYLKYVLNRIENDSSIKEDKKNIIVYLLNERINYIEKNIYKPHNDKIETYLKELEVLKKELVELEKEKSRSKEVLDNVSDIEHYSNSGYIDVYEDVRADQKNINSKKEEIKSKLRNIQKERDILRSYNLK